MREPVYLDDGQSCLFGWHHAAEPSAGAASAPPDCAAVLCPPLGYEYIHSHRSLRHLADRLAAAGIPVLRFDYHGTGDSPGSDLDPDRIATWVANIKTAIEKVRTLSGRARVALVGLRMGATLAALAADLDVSALVLWHPCVSGRHYVREMQALALLADGAARPQDSADGALESAGFLLAADTIEQLKQVNLLKRELKAERVLVLGRDDLAEDSALPDKFIATGIPTDCVTVPGYADMMAEPQFTVVPQVAIDAIVQWLVAQAGTAAVQVGEPHPDSTISGPLRFTHQAGSMAKPVKISEQPCCFGAARGLFGILSRPLKPVPGRPILVLANAGSVHHVGPNRVYVELARDLAAHGCASLRFDLGGLGDSATYDGGRENHPYPPTAVSDVEVALGYLQQEFGYREFIVLGLCSGAHTAFHAGLELKAYDIRDAILINPLTYRWEEGMSLETTQSVQHFQDVAYYKQSVRSGKSWKKLLKGEVQVRYAMGVGLSQLKVVARSQRDAWRERLLKQDSTRLSADLRAYLVRRPRLSLFVARSDPGYDMLLAGAKTVANQAMKQGRLNVRFIDDADHTFTHRASRRELIQAVCEHVTGSSG